MDKSGLTENEALHTDTNLLKTEPGAESTTR